MVLQLGEARDHEHPAECQGRVPQADRTARGCPVLRAPTVGRVGVLAVSLVLSAHQQGRLMDLAVTRIFFSIQSSLRVVLPSRVTW